MRVGRYDPGRYTHSNAHGDSPQVAFGAMLMVDGPPSRGMQPDERRRKKLREARMLRDVPPAESLEMGFSMIRFARELAEAADRARV